MFTIYNFVSFLEIEAIESTQKEVVLRMSSKNGKQHVYKYALDENLEITVSVRNHIY